MITSKRAWEGQTPGGDRIWACEGHYSWQEVDSDLGVFMYSEGHDRIFVGLGEANGRKNNWQMYETYHASKGLEGPAADREQQLKTFANKLLRDGNGTEPFVLGEGIVAGQKVAVMSDGTVKVLEPA